MISARGVLLLSLLVPAVEAAERIVPLAAWADVDEHGQVAAIDWAASVHASLHAAGERALRQYPFSSGQPDQAMLPTRTRLTGQFVLREEGDDYVVSVRDLQAGPAVVRMKPPRWPAGSFGPSRGGSVIAEFVVTADGALASLRVESIDGAPAFAEAVRAALADWRFEPEQIAGVAVASPVCVPFQFTVAGRTPAASPRASDCRLARNGPVAEGQSALWHPIEVTAQKL